MAQVAGELVWSSDTDINEGVRRKPPRLGLLFATLQAKEGVRRKPPREGSVPEIGEPPGPVLSYTMRGYDTDLSKYVFWLASGVDDDASEYTGGNPGSVQDITVFRIRIT
jgi:hypothetical protein